MTLWKQRLFARLHRPADGEGSDLGGAMLDQLAGDTPAAEQQDAPETEQQEEEEQGPSRADALLAELSGEKPAEAAAPETPNEGDAPAAPEAAKPDEAKPEVDAEEAAALEGVRSERGRERIKAVFAERKEIKAERDQLNADITEFRKLVVDTGMDAADFQQSLQFGRLAKSQDPKDWESALQMLEAQRMDLYQRLGKEAPGVDLLSKHDDLRASVDSMEISREKAIELATFRSQQQQAQQQRMVQEQAQQQQVQAQEQFAQARVQMEQYFNSRSKELDHPARWKVISEHFQKPGAMQQFVQQNPEPAQMVGALRWMYDSIQVAQRAPQPSPISARPSVLGKPSAGSMSSEDRTFALMDSMGL